jgi:predicted Zn-dependent protease
MHNFMRPAFLLAALAVIGTQLCAAPRVQAQVLHFIRDAEIEDLLNDYSKPIFKAAGFASQKVKVRIIDDHNFNAFVLDGHNVFINSGALAESKTPNEIIGVIAHESGHIAGGHMAALRIKIQKDQSMALLMEVLGIGAAVAGATTQSGAGKDVTVGAGESILSATPELAMRSILSYRRVQESSADQAGVRFLTATHQSAKGMLTVFKRFADDELYSGAGSSPYLRSHPLSRDRVAQLEEIAQASPYFNVVDQSQLQLRHDLMKAKLIGYTEPPQSVYNRYPPNDTSLPARYARAIAVLNSRGLEAGLPLIDQLIAERPDDAYFWEVKGDFLGKRGKHQEAAEALRKALALLPDQDLIRAELAQELLTTQDKRYLPDVVKLLNKSLLNDETSTSYRQLATAYYGLGSEGDADLASAEASVLEGRVRDAKGFAKRAKALLPSGSQGWLKADDILNIQSDQAEQP